MNTLSAIRPVPAEAGLPLGDVRSTAIPANELDTLGASAIRPAGQEVSFGSLLTNMVQEVNTQQVAAGEAVKGLLSGQNVPLHQAVIAMEEANVSFQLMVEVRNRMLDAYQELMRMQI